MNWLPALVLIAAFTGAGTVLAQAQGGRNAASTSESASKWARLPANQKLALQPLATEWDSLDEAHRRKWMAMARNFDRMNPQEQATLHSRMTDWTALSPRERMRARLNFAEVQRLAPESERKAKWEAYRALSEDERKALADQPVEQRRFADIGAADNGDRRESRHGLVPILSGPPRPGRCISARP